MLDLPFCFAVLPTHFIVENKIILLDYWVTGYEYSYFYDFLQS
jgi:hypothetical protein